MGHLHAALFKDGEVEGGSNVLMASKTKAKRSVRQEIKQEMKKQCLERMMWSARRSYDVPADCFEMK